MVPSSAAAHGSSTSGTTDADAPSACCQAPCSAPASFPAFPYVPYPIQLGFMQQLYRVLQQGGVGLLESPTGTGALRMHTSMHAGREGGREEGRKGGRQEGRDGGREEGRKAGREGGRERDAHRLSGAAVAWGCWRAPPAQARMQACKGGRLAWAFRRCGCGCMLMAHERHICTEPSNLQAQNACMPPAQQ